ncbi:four helix bundle protein [Novipirellula artificiosorum]|nr:four helix bundle protein [Novipirellula artificiosorum]
MLRCKALTLAFDLLFMKTDLPERTFAFAKRIVKLCQTLEEHSGVAETLSRQLIRSGTSIGANVEEGQASQSRKDFRLKYNIACKEARETLYWLRLLAETEIVPQDRLQPMMDECNELVAILTSIVKKLRD